MLSTTFYKSCAAHVPTPRNTSILKMFNQFFYSANEFNSFLQLPLLTQHGTDLFFPTFVVRNYKRSLFLEKYYHWITISTSTRSWYRFFLPRSLKKNYPNLTNLPACGGSFLICCINQCHACSIPSITRMPFLHIWKTLTNHKSKTNDTFLVNRPHYSLSIPNLTISPSTWALPLKQTRSHACYNATNTKRHKYWHVTILHRKDWN